MAFPCTADSSSISVGSSGGNPQWNVNLAPTQTCVGGTATTPNIATIIGGQGLYVPGGKVWSIGDGGAEAPYFVEVPDGYERWPIGFGGPLVKTNPDPSYSTLKTAHYVFTNPTCHYMKVQVVVHGQLNIVRPHNVQIQGGLFTTLGITPPLDFASGSTPGGLVPTSSAGGIDFGILSGTGAATYLGITPMFVDAPSLTLAPGGSVNYWIELYVGVSAWAGIANPVTCDYWSLTINAIGCVDVLT